MKQSETLRIERLLGIILLLSNKRRMSSRELAETFEVSVRTIYRDLDILIMTGVPICTSCGVNGGVELEHGCYPEKTLLSKGELAGIMTALSGTCSAGCMPDINRVAEKIKALIPDSDRQQFIDKQNQIFLDLSPWNESQLRKERLSQIEDAMQNCRMLEIAYQDSECRDTHRMIEPHTLVLRGLSWYLYAYCRLRNSFRVFRVSRIKEIVPTDKTFSKREVNISDMPWNDGWNDPGNSTIIKLRFDEFAYARISECFPEEYIVPTDGGWYTAEIRVPNREWIYSFILSCGSHAEVIEPQSVRDKMCALAADIHSMYKYDSTLAETH